MKHLTHALLAVSLVVACSGQGGEEMINSGCGDGLENVPRSTTQRPIVVIETDSGYIVTEFYPDVAPVTCDSILSLVHQGFYNGLTFHRIIPGFVIQGGDPLGNGTGNAGFKIPAEFSDRPHGAGALSMARSPVDINSSSCQFFICLAPQPALDGQYNLFGRVISGMDVVYKLAAVPTQKGSNKPLEPVVIRSMCEYE